MKITFIKTETPTGKFSNDSNIHTTWFVNGIKVAECKTGWDYYCSIDKQGRPSNLRDKVKKTFETDWNWTGLCELGINMQNKSISADFQDTYPDLTWGYQGSILTKKSLKEKLEKYI